MHVRLYLKTCLTILFIASFSFCGAQSTTGKFEKVKELEGIEEYVYTPNGLKLLLLRDNSAPVVTVQVVYEVGSKHEVLGNTGSTHLLEHLMFKGTPTYNKSKGTSIFKVLQGIGAQMNATTWNDRTNYYETIPSDKMELALHIEADRMRNSILSKDDKEAEMTVVRNEFERGENHPNSLLSKEIWATAYMAHPYHHSTIGWRSDIENMPIEVLREFYDTYYWPDNATLTIIGDFQKENLFGLVDKYFGKISKAPHQIPQPYTKEPVQLGPRQITIKKPGEIAMVSKAFKVPGRMHDDLPALKVLSQLMGSGESSLISKAIVDKGLATYGYAHVSDFREVGLFSVTLGVSPDNDVVALDAKLTEMIEQMKQDGVTQADVDRVVSKLNNKTILSRDGSGSIAGQLTEAIAGGDWRDYITGSSRLEQVTAADVKRVANQYLSIDQSTTGYYLPEEQSSQVSAPAGAANFVPTDELGKFYFRTPGRDNGALPQLTGVTPKQLSHSFAVDPALALTSGERYNRKTIAGIDVVTAKTGAKGFVTVEASLPIASYFTSGGNEMVPDLTVKMLGKGTKNFDKFEFSQKLEMLGSNIWIFSDSNKVGISFQCLTHDVDKIISLLAEELQRPLFDPREFELLKQQKIDELKQGLTDPGLQGAIALSQSIYPKGHPNFRTDIETNIANVQATSLQDLKDFHAGFFGTAALKLVAVGDIAMSDLESPLKKEFSRWKGGNTAKPKYIEPKLASAETQVVTIPQKPSAELFIGTYTGIERNDKEYLPLFLGTNVLGGGFSGRLMQTVRDTEGLTYNIYARHSGHYGSGGYWMVNGSFNPELFDRGLQSTMDQVSQWIKNGISAEELAFVKNNFIGSYKVGMATTAGLANALLSFLERGLSPNDLENYLNDVESVTLEEVNSAIKEYINPNNLIIVKSGSLDQEGNPLK